MRRLIAPTFLLIACLCFTAAAFAQQLSLQFHGTSYHVSERKFNDNNVGLGLRLDGQDFGAQLGVYNNSNYRDTAYLIWHWQPLQASFIKAGVFAGVVTGYDVPMVAGGIVTYDFGRLTATMRVIPRVVNITPMTFGFELGVKL